MSENKNAADPVQIKKTVIKSKLEEEKILRAYVNVMATEEGKTVLQDIMEMCHTFESIWSPSAAIHRNSGQQDVGFFVMNRCLKANKEAFLTILTKSQEKENV